MKKLLTLALSLALTATVGVASRRIRHPARRDSRSGQADSR